MLYEVITYDGISWTWYNLKSGESCIQLIPDDMGNVWVLTNNYRLEKFDGSNWTTECPLTKGRVLARENTGIFWFGTKDAGIARWDGFKWNEINTYNSDLPSNEVHTILIDEAGTKWIGTANGLAVLNDLEVVYE